MESPEDPLVTERPVTIEYCLLLQSGGSSLTNALKGGYCMSEHQEGALSVYRVLDLTDQKGAFCTKMHGGPGRRCHQDRKA